MSFRLTETVSLKIPLCFCSVESSELVPPWFLSGVFHDVIPGLGGCSGRGQRTHVAGGSSEAVGSLQQDSGVASGLKVAAFLQREKEEFGRDEALQASGCNQILHIGNWKETNPCNCVLRFLLSTGPASSIASDCSWKQEPGEMLVT